MHRREHRVVRDGGNAVVRGHSPAAVDHLVVRDKRCERRSRKLNSRAACGRDFDGVLLHQLRAAVEEILVVLAKGLAGPSRRRLDGHILLLGDLHAGMEFDERGVGVPRGLGVGHFGRVETKGLQHFAGDYAVADDVHMGSVLRRLVTELVDDRIGGIFNTCAERLVGFGVWNVPRSGDALNGSSIVADILLEALAVDTSRRQEHGSDSGGDRHIRHRGDVVRRAVRVGGPVAPAVVHACKDSAYVRVLVDDVVLKAVLHLYGRLAADADAIPCNVDVVRGKALDNQAQVAVDRILAELGDRVAHEDKGVTVLDHLLSAIRDERDCCSQRQDYVFNFHRLRLAFFRGFPCAKIITRNESSQQLY